MAIQWRTEAQKPKAPRYLLVVAYFYKSIKNKNMITITKIGYNIPSGANWAYGVWLVTYNDPKDTCNRYFMSWTVKENFGGDSRFKEQIEQLGYTVAIVKGVYPSQKCTGVRSMKDMESKDFIKEVDEFIKNQITYHEKYNH